VRVSQGWPDMPAPNSAQSGMKWEYTKTEAVFWAWLAEAQSKWISVLDAKTGKPFDAGDIDFSLMA